MMNWMLRWVEALGGAMAEVELGHWLRHTPDEGSRRGPPWDPGSGDQPNAGSASAAPSRRALDPPPG